LRSIKTAPGRRPNCCRARSTAYAWLRRTIELLAEARNPEEFLEHTKLELFHDQVFCFTPKGKLIALPARRRRSTSPIAVHTKIGNATVGCKSNGQVAPLTSEPWQPATRSKIITSKAQDSPARPLGIPRGHRQGARGDPPCNAPPRCARQYAGLGRRIVERLFQRAKMTYADQKLIGALPRLAAPRLRSDGGGSAAAS